MAGYNGWSNYETWCVALWQGNEYGSYRNAEAMSQDAWDGAEADGTFSRLERARIDLADRLKEQHDEAMHDLMEQAGASASVWADLLGAALSEVDWQEIAGNLLDDADKTEDVPAEAEDE